MKKALLVAFAFASVSLIGGPAQAQTSLTTTQDPDGTFLVSVTTESAFDTLEIFVNGVDGGEISNGIDVVVDPIVGPNVIFDLTNQIQMTLLGLDVDTISGDDLSQTYGVTQPLGSNWLVGLEDFDFLQFDLVGSGEVLLRLLDDGQVIDSYSTIVSADGADPLLGDADGDGDVDGDDLIAVQTSFGDVGSTPLLGDADFDGDVDGDDLIAVQTNFGATASVAIPEPTAVGLLATASLLSTFAAARRR